MGRPKLYNKGWPQGSFIVMDVDRGGGGASNTEEN